MKRVLVTGATGFLGRYVALALEARGVEVVRFSRGQGEGAGDILDRAAVQRAAQECDGAIHCAGRVSRAPEDSEAMHRVHVLGTRSVLDACEAAGVSRVVVASSSGVVAVSEDAEHVATESDPTPYALVNQWPYYRAKLWAEEAALARSSEGFAVVAVNPSLLLGPGDERGSSVGDVRLFLAGSVAAVPAGGVSFVDARDAADAMVRALDQGRGGQRYLVGACNLTLREFFARLARVSGVPAPVLPLPHEATRAASMVLERLAAFVGKAPAMSAESLELAQYYWYLDASRAEAELGWSPRDPIATLADTVADLRARGLAPGAPAAYSMSDCPASAQLLQ